MRKFRLLLMMSSLLALVCSFTACNTDVADDYPAVEISLTAGEAVGNTLTFTVKATGADDIYYWVETVDPEAEVEAEPELNIEDASYLDAQVDVDFEQAVTVTAEYNKQYVIYAYAKNFAHNAYANEISISTGDAPVVVPAPEISVKADEDEIYEDAFLMWVTTKNATKAAWLVVPKYTEGVTVDKVFETGVALATTELNKETAVTVEDLTPDTEYDFYAAVENSEGVQVISTVVAVTTAKNIPVIEMQFTELRQTQNLAQLVDLPGLYFMLANEAGDKCTLLMYDISQIDNYPGYMANGMYPALTGSFDTMALPEATCLLADPGYTQFMSAAGAEYLPVGNMGVDADGNPYGINLMTGMPDEDKNLLEFNIYAVNAATNEPVIIRGQYMGPLGYVASIATWPFDLAEWGFKAFESTTSGDVVTLTSNSINGSFVLNLTTENGNIESSFVVGENVTGGFTSYVEGAPEFFELKSGLMAIAKAEGGSENDYVLIISPRGDKTIMVGQSGAYKIEALEYPITITPAQ